jgi:formate C-acetyltransferase
MLENATAFERKHARKNRSKRFQRIKTDLLSAPVHLCLERADLITTFFRRFNDRKESVIVQKAKALRYLLQHKSVCIFADELIAGNVGRHRKSALIQPELAGVFGCQEILWIDKRKTTPFQIPWKERFTLIFKIVPYWVFRNMIFRAFYPRIRQFLHFALDQLNATYYLINEAGGIGHFLPDYPKMISQGVNGYLKSLEGKSADLHSAARIACEGLVDFADRLAREADRLAALETDPKRSAELHSIARICHKVPRQPAETLHEALQSLWLTHLAICLEGINSAVSFGRMDQYLYPFYRRDIESGRLIPAQAKELLLCFCAKTTEHVFLLTENLSKYHGGYLVVQAAIVGGTDREGHDAVNDLTYLLLDVMEESGLRDPNFQARLHRNSPAEYVKRAAEVVKQGRGVPAFFNDETIVASLVDHGYPVSDARDYGIVGCVEQAIPGKSFLSTDAALFNLPICLELALNQGRRWNSRHRTGASTPDPSTFTDIEMVMDAFKLQVQSVVARMIKDLQTMERGNRDFHPTPLSSMLVEGCLASGRDVTAGGAIYNSSGIQGVGVADTADALAAIEEAVFRRGRITMGELCRALKNNFTGDPKIRAELMKAPKFGNNYQRPDDIAAEVVRIFHDALAVHANTRGGPYVPGFYSSTSHVAFGDKTGALASGRKAGQPFAASMGAVNGCDRLGPTALLNSVAHIDAALAANGYAVNLRFDPNTLAGPGGEEILPALVKGFFDSGGMEVQFNILDPQQLQDARQNPGKYPELVVRVAGYCAYFDDLPDGVKKEIISRTRQSQN